jgi:hypothetical protein
LQGGTAAAWNDDGFKHVAQGQPGKDDAGESKERSRITGTSTAERRSRCPTEGAAELDFEKGPY